MADDAREDENAITAAPMPAAARKTMRNVFLFVIDIIVVAFLSFASMYQVFHEARQKPPAPRRKGRVPLSSHRTRDRVRMFRRFSRLNPYHALLPAKASILCFVSSQPWKCLGKIHYFSPRDKGNPHIHTRS